METGRDRSLSSQKSISEKAAEKVFFNVANLTKLLPTTTVLVFQVLGPRFTNNGKCFESNKWLTAILLGACIISCVCDTFTDTYTTPDGRRVYYGVVTPKGLWTLNGHVNAGVDLSSYRLRVIDVMHAIVSAALFGAVAFMDAHVISCYYPHLSQDNEQLVVNVPSAVAVVGSVFFIVFPTTRHGILSDIASVLSKQSTTTTYADSNTAKLLPKRTTGTNGSPDAPAEVPPNRT